MQLLRSVIIILLILISISLDVASNMPQSRERNRIHHIAKEGLISSLAREDSVTGDFNNDNKIDYLSYKCDESGCSTLKFYLQISDNEFDLILQSNFLNKVYSFEHQLLSIYFQGNNLIIEIEDRYKFTTLETFCFSYSKPIKNFILVSYKFWQKSNIDIDLMSKECTQTFSDSPFLISDIEIENIQTINCIYNFENIGDFDERFDIIKNQKFVEPPIQERINFYIKEFPINQERVAKYNDIGYYLEQKKDYEEAAFILEKVIEKFPDRIVAYINLGDSYWGLEEKQKAKEAYQTYVSLMKKTGKEARIPKRVYERVQ